MLKKFFLFILGMVVILIAVLLINTFTFESKQVEAEALAVTIPENPELRLSEAVKFKTVSYEDKSETDSSEFASYHQYLKGAYPLVDSLLTLETINMSLLYKWEGSDESLNPIVLMSHQDVVPVDENTRDEWEADPFSGEIKDGMIWGRGTMDDKVTMIALMEAVEYLLADGFEPKRSIYLAFGHDEEVGGPDGAAMIAKHLESQNIKAEFVLDEGGYFAEGMLPGVESPLAFINVAEKGFASFKITVTTSGGHSSQPPVDNTIGLLTRAINKLEESQLEYRLVEPLQSQLEYLGPELPFLQKVVFANSWIFGGQIAKGFNAHTTTAPTIIEGGLKANVIPTTAWAIVNFRILPGETIETVQKHIENTIADNRFTVVPDGYTSNPTQVSEIETPSFQMIAKTIRQMVPNAIVTPGLLGGGTDSKYFYSISSNVYRFYPMRITNENLTKFHGLNESISIENFHEITRFCLQLIRNVNEL